MGHGTRFLTLLTGRNLPRIIGQSREPELPSTINEKMIADFTRIIEDGKSWSAGTSDPMATAFLQKRCFGETFGSSCVYADGGMIGG
jgi:hypothetical protein